MDKRDKEKFEKQKQAQQHPGKQGGQFGGGNQPQKIANPNQQGPQKGGSPQQQAPQKNANPHQQGQR